MLLRLNYCKRQRRCIYTYKKSWRYKGTEENEKVTTTLLGSLLCRFSHVNSTVPLLI